MFCFYEKEFNKPPGVRILLWSWRARIDGFAIREPLVYQNTGYNSKRAFYHVVVRTRLVSTINIVSISKISGYLFEH